MEVALTGYCVCVGYDFTRPLTNHPVFTFIPPPSPFPPTRMAHTDEGPDIIDPFIREMVDTLEQERKTAALK